MELKEIVLKVKTKKWKNLDENVILEKINLFLKRNPKIKINELKEKDKETKQIIKFVKQEMHRSYGAFQSDVSKRIKLLDELKNEKDKEEINRIKNKILVTHSSTRERLNIYSAIKHEFKEILEKKTILDLGAGLNPLEFDENKIIAAEFNKDDVDFLNEYFEILNKRSKAVLSDLTKKENIEELKKQQFDVIFAWKLFDLLNSDVIEAILKLNGIKIISFSTKTLGNREMNSPKRKWFEKRLNEMKTEYERTMFENEMFYVIKK